jgi:hypothetical protein
MVLMFLRGEGTMSQNKSMTVMVPIFGDPLHGPLNKLVLQTLLNLFLVIRFEHLFKPYTIMLHIHQKDV